jgi:hypothetical protein
MSEHVETPTEIMGGLSLYSADVDIPEFVSSGSSVGSSVSQSKDKTVEVNAAMFHNAMNKLLKLESTVFFHLLLLVFNGLTFLSGCFFEGTACRRI